VLTGGIALGLILGLVAGGSLINLGSIRLQRLGLLIAAVFLRFGTEIALNAGFPPAEALRLPLLAGSFALLLIALWPNRRYPGLSLAFIGVLANGVVIVVNGGYMPIWLPSLQLAGMSPADVTSALHVVFPAPLDANFLLHLGPFADVIPIPFPIIQNVASIGDAFLTLGLAFFLFAGVVRVPQELDEEQLAAVRRRLADLGTPTRRLRAGDPGAETGLSAAFTDTVALERPLVMGSAGPGLASPSRTSYEPDAADRGTITIPIPRPSEAVARVAQHPYVRLALNGSFSALWSGQLISSFGDRLNQLALVSVVLISTGSPGAAGLAFFAATLPNLLLSPIAGTFVDRWDHKQTMIVSDILRGAIVLVLPVAAITNIVLVYPLIFLVTTISVFFRPARVAILPQIVPEEDLLSANSALWVGETIADVIGYPLAGIFVALLGSAVPLAFWVDSATYLASAGLIATIVVQARARSATDADAPGAGFFSELVAGWHFLRNETVLLANTLQGAAGQFSLGIAIALTPGFVQATFNQSGYGWQASYGFLETGLGLGNLIGGFVIGLIGARFAKGRMVIVGYAAWGLAIFLFAMSNNLGVALGLSFAQGVANMIFVIPSQTMFQERTPPQLMGRVVGFRFALVFGSMTIAMLLGSILGQIFGPAPVIALFGLVTMAAGLAGLFVPAVRDA
jgi:MFS family permease